MCVACDSRRRATHLPARQIPAPAGGHHPRQRAGRVNAVAYFRVIKPDLAITEVEAYAVASSQIAQTTLRSVPGRADLDALLSERDELNDSLRRIIDKQTEPWGIKVTTVEIKDVEIPEAVQQAIPRAAEVERERRVKIIPAEEEFQASQKLLGASEALSHSHAAMQLRYQQTLVELPRWCERAA
jgi:regulator of protease activity HflC (stomatin/prohibitin superfamily)